MDNIPWAGMLIAAALGCPGALLIAWLVCLAFFLRAKVEALEVENRFLIDEIGRRPRPDDSQERCNHDTANPSPDSAS